MKTLINKTIVGINKPTENHDAPKEDCKYSDLIMFACGLTDNQPISLAEQRIRFKLMDAVENANGEINLEEAWLPVLKKCIDNISTTALSRDFVKFADEIDEIQPTKN